MREIIFRGKDIYANEWVEGSLILYKKPVTARTLEDSFENHYYIVPFDMGYEVEVDPKTIGQFTGLTDKNDVKIFEGDVIDTPDRLVKVTWFNNNAQFDLEFLKYAHNKIITNFRRIDMQDLKHLEVIGNIHDNPELLEVK